MDAKGPFVALVIYSTTAEAQSALADRLARIATETLKSAPGFLGARVLVSEDEASLVTLTEWSDRQSFLEFRQSETGSGAVLLVSELHPKSYWLHQHGAVEST